MCVLATATLAQDSDPADWTGQWETTWRDGGGRLILEQTGATVTGSYPLFDGRIEGTAEGRVLRGQWFEDGQSGTFEIVQSQNGQSFAGRFDGTEWWTGGRAFESDIVFDVDQSSPAAVMRSFLAAANGAVDGDFDALRVALSVILPLDANEDVNARLDRAQAFFSLIDQTTLNLRDLPVEADDGPEGDTASAILNQAGTGASVTVSFRRQGADWFLDPGTSSELTARGDAVRIARTEALSEAQVTPGQYGTPRDTMRTFLLSFRHSPNGSAPEALATLDLRGRPEITRDHDGQVLAGYLKRVIDRAGYVIWQEIPDDPLSDTAYVHFQHPEGNIVIAPVETETGVTWQFTPDTLRTIRAVYTAMEDMPVAAGLDALPEDDQHFAIRRVLRQVSPSALLPFGAYERWQWAGLALTLVAMGAVAWLVDPLRRLTLRRRHDAAPPGILPGYGVTLWAIRGIAAGLVLLAAGWVLGLPEGLTLVLVSIATVLVVFGIFLLGWLWIGRLAESYRTAERVTGHNLILLSLASGVLRGLWLVAAVLIVADQLSIPLTGVLASFGIGGIAFALAAQPTLQNLLSGFTIYADRPLSVGDFCRFGDKMGTVEEIGLRSTRLRTLDRTVISVPNSQFLDMELENYARRDRFLFTTTLGLRYETSPDQLRYVLTELRKLLIAHPMVVSEPLRVRFAGFGAHSLDVEIFSYILASDIDAFSAIREDLLLRIMATVDAAGTQFAFPSMVHYDAKDKGLEADRVAEAEATVESWRASGDLPFPDFEWQSKAELSGSLDYPPMGSATRRGEGAD
jgi:small-conductance mechanosensitive channel